MDWVPGDSFLSSTHPSRSGLWALGHIFLRISYLLIPQTLIIIICSPCASILWHNMFHSSGNHSDLGERQPGKLRCFLSAGCCSYYMMLICTTREEFKRTKITAMVQNVVALWSRSNFRKQLESVLFALPRLVLSCTNIENCGKFSASSKITRSTNV